MKIAAIIPAAGESKRLGHPKQLIEIAGVPQIRRIVDDAVNTPCHEVIVVTGSSEADVIRACGDEFESRVQFVHNENWSEGMGSSIACGAASINAADDFDAVFILLCDQLYVNAGLLREMISCFEQEDKDIVCCNYGQGSFGPPVLFATKYIEELKLLRGDIGAKSLLKKYDSQVTQLFFAEGACDLDTFGDIGSCDMDFEIR